MFHAKEGWFFERYPKGGVAIIKRETANEQSRVVSSIILTPEEWASVVASVSAGGEFNGRWKVALDFHSGLTQDAADELVGSGDDPNWPDRDTLGVFDEPA